MGERVTPTQLLRAHGYKAMNLGGGYGYCKFLPPRFGELAMVYITAECDCANGRIKSFDERCIVFLDYNADSSKDDKQEYANTLTEALDIANRFYGEAIQRPADIECDLAEEEE